MSPTQPVFVCGGEGPPKPVCSTLLASELIEQENNTLTAVATSGKDENCTSTIITCMVSATHRDFDDYGQNQISAVQFSPTGQYLAIVTDDR